MQSIHSSSAAADAASVVPCRVAGSDRCQLIDFGVPADLAAARRWRAGFRRIDRVDVQRQGTAWACTIRAVGHRRPVNQPVPLRIALGLAKLGTPLVVKEATHPW